MGNISLGGERDIPFTAIADATAYNYTSSSSETVTGTTTYAWTAKVTDVDGNEVVTSDVEFGTASAKDTTVTFKAPGDFKIRCKWTNEAYNPTTATGLRTATVADS